MKLLLVLMIFSLGIGAEEINEVKRKCESIDVGERYLKCDNGKFYERVQKSFNSNLLTEHLEINDSKTVKKVYEFELPNGNGSSSSNTSK